MNATNNESAAALRDLFAIVRRHRLLIATCLLITTGSAVVWSLAQRKQYSASAEVLFREPALDQNLFSASAFTPEQDPTRQNATNVKLVKLETVAARTAQALGSGLTRARVSREITVSADGESNIASITATDPNPSLAAALANTYANEFIATRRDADQAALRQAQQMVHSQLARLGRRARSGAAGRSLAARSEQLGILSSLQTGNAELVQPALTPTSPSSPKPARNGLLGALLGLILGGTLAFVYEHLDRRLRSTAELEQAFGLPLLGVVAHSPALARMRAALTSGSELESFGMLRAQLRYFNVERPVRSVLVTSGAPGDGKTTVALNLSIAAAIAGDRVLLVEADMRRPQLARLLLLGRGPGLSEMLGGLGSERDAIRAVSLERGRNGNSASVRIDVLPGGATPPNPTELLESNQMANVMSSFHARYDLVVIDSPPVSFISDAIPLTQRVDGVLLVCRLGRSTRELARHLRNQLENLKAHVLGIVANDVKPEPGGYYYGYQADGYYGDRSDSDSVISANAVIGKTIEEARPPGGHPPVVESVGSVAESEHAEGN